MGGFPLVNGLVIVALLAAALLPLMALTGRGTRAELPSAAREDSPVNGARPARATLRFAHRPALVALSHLGRVLWSQDGLEANEVEAELSLPFFEPGDGIELLVEVSWPEGTPETVAHIILEPESLEGRSHTAWGQTGLAELAVFVWGEESP